MTSTTTTTSSASRGSNSAQALATESLSSKAREEFKKEEVSNVDGFIMPELDQLLDQTEVAKELSPEEIKEAYKDAGAIDIANSMQLLDFGLDVQHKASEVTRQFISEARSVDLEKLAKLASQTNKTMEELGIGELKPSWRDKFLGMFLSGKRAEEVKVYLEKHRALSELVNKSEIGLAGERLKLSEHHKKMTAKINENRDVYTQLSKKIGAGELSYVANCKRVQDWKKQYEGSTDGAKARDISKLDEALTMQARKINTLKASRQETLTALRTMDMQLQGIESQISMIDEQVSFNRLVWDNSVLMVATDKRMENAVKAVTYNRGQIEKMMKERGGNIAETLAAIKKEQGEGVVNASVLEFAAEQVAKTNLAMIKCAKENRERLAQADQMIKRMDTLLKDSAAALSDEERQKLEDQISGGGEKVH